MDDGTFWPIYLYRFTTIIFIYYIYIHSNIYQYISIHINIYQYISIHINIYISIISLPLASLCSGARSPKHILSAILLVALRWISLLSSRTAWWPIPINSVIVAAPWHGDWKLGPQDGSESHILIYIYSDMFSYFSDMKFTMFKLNLRDGSCWKKWRTSRAVPFFAWTSRAGKWNDASKYGIVVPEKSGAKERFGWGCCILKSLKSSICGSDKVWQQVLISCLIIHKSEKNTLVRKSNPSKTIKDSYHLTSSCQFGHSPMKACRQGVLLLWLQGLGWTHVQILRFLGATGSFDARFPTFFGQVGGEGQMI